jgi:hypothetical protein
MKYEKAISERRTQKPESFDSKVDFASCKLSILGEMK